MHSRRLLPFTLSAAALLGLSATAQAQSSVTVYGLIDVSVNHIRFGDAPGRGRTTLTTLSSDASRLGFRGSEDLGGGMRAYFKLETGVSFDTGAATNANQFWSREAYVGLGHRQYGSLQFGSHYSPEIFTSARVDPFGRFGLGAFYGILQGSPRGWAVTLNNVVQYATPNLSGFQGRVQVGAGEGAATGRSVAGSLEYAKGPVYAVLNHQEVNVAAATVGLTGSPVKSQTTSLGATYDFKVVKLSAWLQRNRVERVAADARGAMLGLVVPVSSGEIRATHTRRDLSNADATQTVLGYHHFLSKRTALFAQAGVTRNEGTAAFGIGPSRGEQNASGQLVAGRDLTAVQFGIRHVF